MVEIVRAIKSVAGSDAPVVIDPNLRFYRLCETLAIASKLEEFTNVMLEDPFPLQVGEWQLFRQSSRVPLVLHSAGDLSTAIQEHCCDHLNLGGSAWQFLADAHLAWTFGMRCWHGSGVELGILDAFILHKSAAARCCTLAGDAFGHLIRSDDLIVETLEIRNGAIRVPTGPGLGVTLDKKAVAKYAQSQWEMEAG